MISCVAIIPDHAKADMINRAAGTAATGVDFVDEHRHMGTFIALYHPVGAKIRISQLLDRPGSLILFVRGKRAGQGP